jgi:hypothetical protein
MKDASSKPCLSQDCWPAAALPAWLGLLYEQSFTYTSSIKLSQTQLSWQWESVWFASPFTLISLLSVLIVKTTCLCSFVHFATEYRLKYKGWDDAEERNCVWNYTWNVKRVIDMPKYSMKTNEDCMNLELVGNCRQSFVVTKQWGKLYLLERKVNCI